MAKIKTSALIADIKGTVGGNVFASNKGGNYVRRGKKPTNANTAKQQVVRTAFGTQSGLWRSLTEAQRRSWIEGAVNFPYTDSLGETKIYSGQQLFNKLNNNLIQYGLTTLEVCPLPQSFPLIEWVSLTNETTGNVLEGNFTIGGGIAVPANFICSIAATQSMSAGISAPQRQRFKNIKVLVETDSTEDVSLIPEYDNNFSTLIAGDTIFVSLMLVNTISGEASIMSDIKSTRVA
jgi:hypothetical protein